MKYFYYWSIVGLLSFVPQFSVYSQFNVVKVDAVGAVSNLPVLRFGYERSFSKGLAWGIGFETGKYASTSMGSLNGPMFETYKVTGWGIVPEIRLYPFNSYKPAPIGFFIGSHLRYRNLKESDRDARIKTSKANAFNIGVSSGYKVRISQFVMDIAVGYGPSFGKWKSNKGRYTFDHFEDKFRFELSLGFVFPKIPRKDKSGKYLYL